MLSYQLESATGTLRAKMRRADRKFICRIKGICGCMPNFCAPTLAATQTRGARRNKTYGLAMAAIFIIFDDAI
jgi:hypothetical protein